MINNFLINRVLSVTGFDNDDNILYRLTQPQNVGLSTTSETAEVVDALGTPIAVFDRSKSAELTGENAIFDMKLLAEQHGTKVSGAVASVPCFETLTVVASTETPADKQVAAGSTYTLKYTPVATSTPKAYTLNEDSSLGAEMTVTSEGGTAVSAVADGKLAVPADAKVGSKILISYEYKPDNATQVVVSSDTFANAHKIVVEILGCDVCNTEEMVYAYLIMENAKMSSDTDLSFGTDLVHSFTVSAQVSYCSPDKRLFYIVIPE